MNVALGCDHAGYSLKRDLMELLDELGIAYEDFGSYDTAPSDYPDVAKEVGLAIAKGDFDRGILVCGTGIGTAIAANKVKGVRAAPCHDTFSARMSREHNNANVLCLGARVVGRGLARDIVQIWLATDFSEAERHQRRLEKIAALERSRPRKPKEGKSTT
ncbi:MAG: ribose 5-phosphate isomerase B [Chloroflexota bacterium]